MKQLSGREVCNILTRHGWELKRINGSHHIFLKPGNKERISVPVMEIIL
jgi:predicted RNA binding protein YcfA (HicA-like mRNA interferase family)